MSEGGRAIARAEAGHALEALSDDATVQDRLRAAFTATKGHWLETDPDEQMRAAIEAVYLKANEEEQDRIREELDGLRSLTALMSGVPVDMSRVNAPENPIGIAKLYREVMA